jgi:hypothetical protein
MTPEVGCWYHLVGVRDDAGQTFTPYLDGNQVASVGVCGGKRWGPGCVEVPYGTSYARRELHGRARFMHDRDWWAIKRGDHHSRRGELNEEAHQQDRERGF